ncbi:hypothetical protein IWW37_003368 [Coemansia sp. RSA 2050]|nr:hypothetical protein IWW37_003368 [Coemansia sp. RSA 2050]KAJ2732423.1 hypothetical protein IW152_003818 [Coemansia sp. BCRC 34962]
MAKQGPRAIEALNMFLSRNLPSLREIEFHGPNFKAIYGPYSKATCGGALIKQFIRERLHGPETLRAVRVKSDCWPKLTDDYDTGTNAPPVSIECMEIDGPDDTYLMPVPVMESDTLVKLKLTTTVAEYVWKLFGRLSDLKPIENHSNYSRPPLVFSSLKSLAIGFVGIKQKLGHMSAEDKLSYEGADNQLYNRFCNLPGYGAPEFPVLTRLEIHNSFSGDDLEVFARSPILTNVLLYITRL